MEAIERVKKFIQKDRFAKYIGIEILDISLGRAKASMKIEDHHLNAANVVHGSAIFGLADLVFAVASNSHGKVSLGINMSVSYLKAASGGTLFAEAKEISKNKKLGTYLMEVTDEQNDIIAILQGTVYRKNEDIGGAT